jgi:glycosyltransferase involved in cell wall biosynthesis
MADVILAPYQRHVGMSGILLLAAAAQKPVLSSNYGLMGEIVRRYELGLTVDSTEPKEIAKGLTRFLVEDSDKLCDRAKMKSFAEQNSAEEFARVIFEHL